MMEKTTFNNKLLNILAALALTAAALAASSAYAWIATYTGRMDPFDAIAGISRSHDTSIEAFQEASSACHRRGRDCQIKTFVNTCIGFAEESAFSSIDLIAYHSGSGNTIQQAQLDALQICRVSGSTGRCEISNIRGACDITCGTNASLVNGFCTCNSGFTGDGFSCTANANPPACGTNASLVNGFCTCNSGFTGDGFSCTANANPPACGTNASLVNGFCTCNSGFTGNGFICTANNGGGGGTDTGGGTTTTTTSSGGGGGSAAGIIGGVVVVALALWYFTSGSDDLTWTPSYAFANNGNVSYSVGNRWTATANDWRIYWQTRQTDKFVYGSGMQYNNGILSAAMNSESSGKQTDLDLALTINESFGLWNLGGGYQFGMQLSDDATESQNRLNAKVGYIMDKWILSANANTDGKTTRTAVNYSYRF